MLRGQVLAGSLTVAAWPVIGRAQAARKTARVGWLGSISSGSAQGSLPVEALRSGLVDLGWKEGVKLVLERREGERGQVPALVAELLRANVDAIVVQGPLVAVARAPTRARRRWSSRSMAIRLKPAS